MNSQKSKYGPKNASDALGPVADNLGREIVNFSFHAHDTIANMEHHGLPNSEILLNLAIGILSGIRSELKNRP